MSARANRVFLVGVELPGQELNLDVGASLEELGLLADTAGLEVVGETSQRLSHPDPATFIGKGKVAEVQNWVEELRADVVLFDDELSPRHQRELERAFGERVRVLDRTALILDIFAQHARTKEGALQVSLAQYSYRLPRLTRQWTHLARQSGGGMARGGAAGVGLRGPGETQLETDRREIRRRIAQLRAELDNVEAHRMRYRAKRRRAGMPVIGLVGYTNAGKSTLLNRLSGAGVYVADQLFATLDPTTRQVQLPQGRTVLFTDTVGFIQKLPHTLVSAFHSTLEEIKEASVLVHVVDAIHPHAGQQIDVVAHTLNAELGMEGVPTLLALNKIDLAEALEQEDRPPALPDRLLGAIPISARTGEGVLGLLSAIESVLERLQRRVVLRVPYSHGDLVAAFHQLATVTDEHHVGDYVELTGSIDARFLGQFAPYITNDR